MRHFKVFAAAVFTVASFSLQAAAETGQVKAVFLSSGGIAEVLREAKLDGNGSVTLEVPTDQVNDILKSLVVRDSSGTVLNMSMAGPSSIEEAFRGLPFNSADLKSLPRLLGSLQGAEVTIESGRKTLTGKVLGVDEKHGREGETNHVLSILGEDGISTVSLSTESKVRFLQPEIEQKLAEAAAKAARRMSETSRTISIEIEGEGERTVLLSYAIPAPVWKTSYRLVAGDDRKARLQAWAILENATGEDWDDVKVKLTSGNPSTLTQELYNPIWRNREAINIAVADQPAFRPDAGAMVKELASDSARSLRAAAPQAAFASAEAGSAMPAPVRSSTPMEGDVTSTFELPGVHDLAEGDTISIPIVDASVDAEKVSVFSPEDGSVHPVAAIEIFNETGVSLPAGILTVYDGEHGYVGDSALLAFPAGERRLARFATDNKVRIVTDTKPGRTVVGVKVSDGILHATVKAVEETTYTVRGASDGERTVVIEHPRKPGWEFRSPSSNDMTRDHYRLKTKVLAGETVKVSALSERTMQETYALTDAHPQLLLDWASSSDGETAERLKKLAEARQKQDEARRKLDQIEQENQRLSESQSRIRMNLEAVPEGSDLQGRYMTMMQSIEDQISDLEKARKEAESSVRQTDSSVREIIRTF